MSEQRQWARVPAMYAIGFEHYSGSQKVGEGQARSVNLSGRGMAFETNQPMRADDTLIIWLLNVYYTLQVRGVVKHVRKTSEGTYIVGVQLEKMIEGDWKALERDIERMLQQQRGSQPPNRDTAAE